MMHHAVLIPPHPTQPTPTRVHAKQTTKDRAVFHLVACIIHPTVSARHLI